MSENTRSPSNRVVAAADDESPAQSPTVRYQEIAAKLTAHVQAMRDLLPMLVSVTPETQALVRRKKRIPQSFVNNAVDTLSLATGLQSVPQLEVAPALDAAAFVEIMRPVKLNVAMFDQSFGNTLAVSEATLATTAQKVYGVARGLAVDPKESDLVQHVAQMKRLRSTPRRKKPDPEKSATPPPAAAEGGAAHT
jgi:hypothetical protein